MYTKPRNSQFIVSLIRNFQNLLVNKNAIKVQFYLFWLNFNNYFLFEICNILFFIRKIMILGYFWPELIKIQISQCWKSLKSSWNYLPRSSQCLAIRNDPWRRINCELRGIPVLRIFIFSEIFAFKKAKKKKKSVQVYLAIRN